MQSDLPTASREEGAFYARYDWCLNPILSLGDLFRRLREELDGAPGLALSWQRAESRINAYLFACAIACTVDDYLSRPLGDLSPIAAHFPRLRFAVGVAERLLQGVQAVRGALSDRAVVRWRRRWERCVDAACDALVREVDPPNQAWIALDARIRALPPRAFPATLLRRRMALPAAFRNQDLTHHDIAALADRVAGTHATTTRPVVVLGLRTAGAYFAPLLAACLAARGAPVMSWMSIRPKQALSAAERRKLRDLRRSGAHVVVVDEPPNSGKTIHLTLALLARAGVPADRVTVAVPRSPAKPEWTLPGASPRLVVLDPPDYAKARLLEPAEIAALLREYCGPNARLPENVRVEALNARLRAHHLDGFHVRLKRVFEVRDIRPGTQPASTFVMAKSVGWGWLGYHAYVAGARLAGLVPRVLGLRDGLLFTEWVGELEAGAVAGAADLTAEALGAYVATRARRLGLAEDPCYEDLGYGRTGWSELVNLLKRAYGMYLGRLKVPTLHRRLKPLVSPVPALIDGRMKPEEWVGNGTGTFKADFEHHCFGKTELNVVDPAYDLAAATFAFDLSPERERQLVRAYATASGDRSVEDRILPYKLLDGALAMTDALSRASGDRSEARHEWNRRYLGARSRLASQLNRFSASRIPTPAVVTWTDRLFFLDLDGVFDSEAFGFPHTTASGLAALALLRVHGFSVVLNTGRAVEDVHSYCRDYALPGGIGELGGVFVDAVAGREIPLIDDQAAAQLARCREILSRLEGVCIDPTYRYAVRAYRYANERTVPLPAPDVEKVLQQAGLGRLVVSPSSVDVIVLARDVDKGRAQSAARAYLGCADQPVAAIGDSNRDVPMLAAADYAFAPSGCSTGIRALAASGRCRIMSAPMQHGLLRAVRELVRERPLADLVGELRPPAPAAPVSELMEALLQVAERSRLRQCLSALAWWSV